jgi:hypothetical protein
MTLGLFIGMGLFLVCELCRWDPLTAVRCDKKKQHFRKIWGHPSLEGNLLLKFR